MVKFVPVHGYERTLSLHSPQRNQLEDAHVFSCYGQDMEGPPEVRGEGDVMDWISDGHQGFCFGILPVRRRNDMKIMKAEDERDRAPPVTLSDDFRSS